MILLYSLLLFSVINLYQELSTTSKVPDTTSFQQNSRTVTTDEILDLRLQISQLNAKFEHQNTKLAKQNTKFEAQNVKISDQNVKIADQNTKLAEQNLKICEQNTKIKDLEMKIEEIEKKGNKNIQLPTNNSTYMGSGSLFTRWGRRDCPRNISQLVFSGITGGSRWQNTGGAAEYVCLPPDPIWNVNKYYNGNEWGYMYGTRYKETPTPLLNYKVPCAVCRTSQFSTVLMIPARSKCYQGWQRAYHGELVSGNHTHYAASQYVCLDDEPQATGTNTSNYAKLMYPVRAQCGSLPCPPYEDNTLLTCVVCLK